MLPLLPIRHSPFRALRIPHFKRAPLPIPLPARPSRREGIRWPREGRPWVQAGRGAGRRSSPFCTLHSAFCISTGGSSAPQIIPAAAPDPTESKQIRPVQRKAHGNGECGSGAEGQPQVRPDPTESDQIRPVNEKLKTEDRRSKAEGGGRSGQSKAIRPNPTKSDLIQSETQLRTARRWGRGHLGDTPSRRLLRKVEVCIRKGAPVPSPNLLTSVIPSACIYIDCPPLTLDSPPL